MRAAKILAVLLLLAIACPLGGCAMPHQPEHRAYVISMGVDINDNSDCVVSIQIPSITGSSGGADGGGGADSYVVSSATAHTFVEALVLLQATTPRELDYKQMVSFVASQKAASSPVFPQIVTELMHTYEIFHSPQLIVCAGEAAAFLESQRPEIGTRLSSSVSAMLNNYQRDIFRSPTFPGRTIFRNPFTMIPWPFMQPPRIRSTIATSLRITWAKAIPAPCLTPVWPATSIWAQRCFKTA